MNWRTTILVVLLGQWLLAPLVIAGIHKERLQFDLGLEIDILSGYPFGTNRLGNPLTVGFIFYNKSTPRHLRITLSGDVHTKREIVLPAGERRRLFLYLPHTENTHLYKVTFTDLLNNQQSASRSIRNSGNFYWEVNSPEYHVAQLGSLEVPLNIYAPWKDFGPIDLDHFPDSWQGLAGLSAIVIKSSLLEQATPWRKSLLDWVSMGGLLLVAHPENIPFDPAHLWEGAPPFAAHKAENTKVLQVGLGRIIAVPPKSLSKVDQVFFVRYGGTLLTAATWLSTDPKLNNQIKRWLRGIGEVPGWRLFLLLVCFAIMVGPLGWWLLVKRRGQPFFYLAGVMVGATLFSGSLLVVNFLAEGVMPMGTVQSLRLLDQSSDTELYMEEMAVYAPTLLGTTLHAPIGTLFLTPPPPYSSGSLGGYRMHTGPAQQTLEGGVPVRQLCLVGQLRLSPLQGRLVIESTGDKLQVENHLGRKLLSLQVVYQDRRYSFGPLDGGEVAVASSSSRPNAPDWPRGFILQAAQPIWDGLRRGTFGRRYFVGVLAAPSSEDSLLQKGLREINKSSKHLIAGRF